MPWLEAPTSASPSRWTYTRRTQPSARCQPCISTRGNKDSRPVSTTSEVDPPEMQSSSRWMWKLFCRHRIREMRLKSWSASTPTTLPKPILARNVELSAKSHPLWWLKIWRSQEQLKQLQLIRRTTSSKLPPMKAAVMSILDARPAVRERSSINRLIKRTTSQSINEWINAAARMMTTTTTRDEIRLF